MQGQIEIVALIISLAALEDIGELAMFEYEKLLYFTFNSTFSFIHRSPNGQGISIARVYIYDSGY